MPALRRIGLIPLRQLKRLLDDDQIPVNHITVKYKDYSVYRNIATILPHEFQRAHEHTIDYLYFGFYTWGTAESKKYPGTFLALGTSTDFRIVGFPLYLLPQDKDAIYLSFKLGNNEGGKNRWFGRGRSSKELRSVAQTDQLAVAIRGALQEAFPEPLFTHPTLSGDWLLLARLPLTDLQDKADLSRRVALKTLIFEKLLHAFVIAEKLRDDSLKAVGMPVSSSATEDEFPISTSMNTPLNQILYGPPGTGKTHHTKARAVGIIEDLTDEEVAETYDREGIRARFEEYRRAGQIEFVTFHQAFGYEDFVEGIKPNLTAEDDLQYRIEIGLFRRMATAAYANWHRATTPADAPAEPAELDFSLVYGSYLADLQARLKFSPDHTVTVLTVGGFPAVISAASDTGIISIRHGSAPLQYNVRAAWTRAVYQQYAQATDIVPVIQKMLEIGGPNASLQWAIFNDLKQYEAGPAPTASGTAEKYVLIIDEINRGNVANIFGELITLLEDDKRAGRPEALTVKLPYSKEDFTVPENLYLLGTMNTADRSVEALDTALRRRFSFTEMLPEPQVIRDKVGANGVLGEGPDAVDVARLLEVLNSRLEQLFDRDHCLGHALLLGIGTLGELRAAFQRNIVPLLQEYFFGDWGKIGLVLGTRFVAVATANAPGRVALAAFPGYEGASQHSRPFYRLTPPESWDAAAFQSIYSAAAAAA
jgi:5-methylcytosine-specific restriction protein B